MSERALTKQIMDHIKQLRQQGERIKAKKLHGSQYQTAGDPDILIVCDGLAIFLEVKKPGGKPTRLQLQRIEEWKAAGAVAGVVRSLDDAKQLIAASGR